MNTKKKLLFTCFLAACSLSTARAGMYTVITIDGNFSDWTSVPVAFTNASGAAPLNISSVKFANDNTNFYFLVNYGTAINPNSTTGGPNLYLALDNDSNAATGFDIFGVHKVGSEAGWQNDTGFAQTSSNFSNGALTGGNLAISPYNSVTTTQEFALSRTATFADGSTIFPNNSFVFGFYSQGNGNTGGFDEFAFGSYTFAAVPEPSTWISTLLIFVCGTVILSRRQFARREPVVNFED